MRALTMRFRLWQIRTIVAVLAPLFAVFGGSRIRPSRS